MSGPVHYTMLFVLLSACSADSGHGTSTGFLMIPLQTDRLVHVAVTMFFLDNTRYRGKSKLGVQLSFKSLPQAKD